jgi:lipoyl(octanoyl) transferase
MKKLIKTRFIDLGRIAYQDALDYQEELFQKNLSRKIKREPTENYLIFCEHEPVYTLGKSGSENNLLVNSGILKKLKVSFFKTNRGGDITYHGPGQIVGYPILDLENFDLGVKTYIHKLESSVIDVLAQYGLRAGRLKGATGVWFDADVPGKARKICAIGVKASRHITMHGFAFNVNTDLKYFEMINPCGFKDKSVTSLKKELDRKLDMDEVKEKLKQALLREFGMEV